MILLTIILVNSKPVEKQSTQSHGSNIVETQLRLPDRQRINYRFISRGYGYYHNLFYLNLGVDKRETWGWLAML